ncbi:ATP-dependent nuclease [Lapillicoccus jejuensis]|uniref:ATP-dependent nuclease n=1 Tax=Lapillicoccus jejuensis TaxID=402171 RepID=UPI0014776BCF|nr:AAA family ATPase [Lapillicoccus jejuensis]
MPIRRDHEVAHDPAGGLLERAVEEWVSNHSQRDRRSPEIAQVATRLREKSLAGLEKQLRSIAPLDGPFSFELTYSIPPDYRLLLQNLALTVKEGGQSIPLSDSGSGTQSMAVFALYAYLAELESTTYLLGLEEPEQNLHPQAQQQLMRNLSALDLQVVFTTHSPTIVDTLDHEHVVMCKRTTSKKRELEVRISQISRTFFVDHQLDRERYYKFHRRRNSEFLFADFVVVTEGPVDAVVVERLLVDAGTPPDQLGISVVPLDGVTSIDYMFHLLRGLQIEAAFVVDRDYFLPYKNGERKNSLDSRGFPQFGSTLQAGCLLKEVLPKGNLGKKIIDDLSAHPSDAMRALIPLGFFSFMWSLEVDLVNASTPRTRMLDQLGVPEADRSTKKLLVDKSSAIKRQEVLLPAIAGLGATALPTSYKSLRREIPKLAEAARSR